MSVGSLMTSGPLILAVPVAAAAGAVTFLSPCCLPLVPGYLSYVTGMSGAGAESAGADAESDSAESDRARLVGAASGARPVGAPRGAQLASAGPAEAPAAVPARPPRSRVLAGTALFVLGF